MQTWENNDWKTALWKPIEGDFYFHRDENSVVSGGALHFHNRLEIYYLTDGSCNYFIDDQSYKLMAGDVVIIPEGVMHKTNYGKVSHSRWLINCETDFVPRDLLEKFSSTAYISRIPWIQDTLKKLFRRIRDEYEHPDEYSTNYIKCYITELLLLLAREQKLREGVSVGKKIVEKAVNYIKANFTETIKLEDIAGKCYVSPCYLSRTFKKEIGVGISEYILLLRLKCAQEMCLNDPKKPIEEIAHLCGFQNRNYFTVMFKKKIGITPSELRFKDISLRGDRKINI